MLVQIAWNRLADLVFGPSVYVFPLVTAVVLAGGAAGGALAALYSKGRKLKPGTCARLALIGAALLVAGTHFFARGPLVVLRAHLWLAPDFAVYWILAAVLAVVCLLPAAALMGALFPAAATLLVAEDGRAERLGLGLAVNVAGLVLGAVAGTFGLTPLGGPEALIDAAAAALVIVVVARLPGALRGAEPGVASRRRQAFALASGVLGLIGLIAALPRFDWELLTASYFYNRVRVEAGSPIGGVAELTQGRLLEVAHDPHATISIHESLEDKRERWFKVSGKTDGNNGSDVANARLVAELPRLVMERARSALVIGLGLGATAASALSYDGLESLTVVELSAAVTRLAREYFGDVNRALFADPRFKLIVRDGREYLEHSSARYDVIASQPSNPWVAGVGSLFTREFFATVARRLEPGGVASLWFHTYGLDCPAVMSALKAAAEEFGSVLVLRDGGNLYVLAARESALRFNPARATPDFLVSHLALDRDAILSLARDIPANTDDNQLLQFRAGRTFFRAERLCPELAWSSEWPGVMRRAL
jgi:spermidine synthase